MPSNSFSKVTRDIRVVVQTAYIPDESSPRHQHYVFAYQIEITNSSSHTVQLLTREWHILDGLGEKRLVQGDGVIGKQPVLAPGKTHQYVSGCHFSTPVGKMSGFYMMEIKEDQSRIKVDIPPFVMVAPYLNN